MDKERVERLVSAHEHRVNCLHRIATELESLDVPTDEIVRILDDIQEVVKEKRKDSW